MHRIAQLNKGEDMTLEVLNDDLKVLLRLEKVCLNEKIGLVVSSDIKDISLSNVFITTVLPCRCSQKTKLKPLFLHLK